jgi:hypothetical protein
MSHRAQPSLYYKSNLDYIKAKDGFALQSLFSALTIQI